MTGSKQARGRTWTSGFWPWALSLAILGVACSAHQRPAAVDVEVRGKPSAVASLVGVWRGEYSSPTTGRSGMIRFEFPPGGASGGGFVAMMTTVHPIDAHGESSRPARVPVTSLLNIHLVQVDDTGTVAGALEPYRDPTCNCLLSTSFVGHIVGERITGSFVSHGGPGHPTTYGRWQVDRH